jgi:hypothetical protein
MRRLFFVLLLVGCTPRPAATSTGTATNDCWPVVPLRLDAFEHESEWEPMVWLEADGSVHHSKGNAFARVTGDRAHLGNEDLVCNPDRTVGATGGASGVRYDANDVLLVDAMKIFVRDDGEVEMTDGAQPVFGPGGKGRARVVGDVRGARRTAELLVLIALAGPAH